MIYVAKYEGCLLFIPARLLETGEFHLHPFQLREQKEKIPLSAQAAERCKLRSIMRKQKRKQFVKWVAYNDLLPIDLSEIDINNAKKGILPPNYDIHHNIPRCAGGKDEFDNYCLIHRQLHIHLHYFMWDIVLKNVSPDQKCYMALPPFCATLTQNDYDLFFTSKEKQLIQAPTLINVRQVQQSPAFQMCLYKPDRQHT